MSVQWDAQALLAPISAEQPCGLNLDETPLLAPLESLRLFGQARSPEAPPDAEEGEKEQQKVKAPPAWDQIRGEALDLLAKSKDLRLLAYVGTAFLRTDGLLPFTQVLPVAAQWLETYWGQVYPLLDEDAVIRRNALNCLADPMAVVDRVWRMPLVTSRQHGRFSLRDIDIAGGVAQPTALEAKPDEAAIRAALAEMTLEEVSTIAKGVTDATAAMTRIDAKMRGEGGPEVAPDFGPLSTQFAKLNRVLTEQLALRNAATAADGTAGQGAAEAAAGFTGGAIKSRQDAIRALDAVADFFKHNEPSSPIPLFVERAKRLVTKDFLEVLADIAPDAVTVARSAGGLKPDQ